MVALLAEVVMVFSPGAPPPAHHWRWQELGGRLAAARVAHHWTVRQVAGRVGVDIATARLWETGHHRPKWRTLRCLATLLEVPYAELAALAQYPVALAQYPVDEAG